MRTKKGVSPLIATVLLLAFAVALATVIIQLEPFNKCVSKVNVKTNNGVQRICYNVDSGQIELFIVNNDKKEVNGFKVIVSATKEPLNIGRIALNIGQNEEGKLRFDFDPEKHGEIMGIKIFPQINRSNRIEECEMPDEILSVPLCES